MGCGCDRSAYLGGVLVLLRGPPDPPLEPMTDIDIPWYRPIETWVALDGDRKIVGGPSSSAAAAQRNAERRGMVPQRTITWTEFKQEPVE